MSLPCIDPKCGFLRLEVWINYGCWCCIPTIFHYQIMGRGCFDKKCISTFWGWSDLAWWCEFLTKVGLSKMGLNFKALIETGFKWLHTMLKKTRGVSHCGLANYFKKSILRQRKNYGNSNNSPCKNMIFKKQILQKKPKSFKIS